MEVIFMLIGFSLLVALVFFGSFVWAVKTGQYNDRYTPAVRMLFDDAQPKPSQSNLLSARRNNYAE